MNAPVFPKDKNKREIHAGDTIRMTFHCRQREHAGRRRVAEVGLSGREVVVPDEGDLGPPSVEWVEFLVKWSGACLVAERTRASDLQTVMSGENMFIGTDKHANAASGTHLLNGAFRGEHFVVVRETT